MIEYKKIMFNIGIVLAIVSILDMLGFFRSLFKLTDINHYYSFLTGGIAFFLLVPRIYFDAKEKERKYGNMSIRDRESYIIFVLFGVLFIIIFFSQVII
jgi:hypothetical protein